MSYWDSYMPHMLMKTSHLKPFYLPVSGWNWASGFTSEMFLSVPQMNKMPFQLFSVTFFTQGNANAQFHSRDTEPPEQPLSLVVSCDLSALCWPIKPNRFHKGLTIKWTSPITSGVNLHQNFNTVDNVGVYEALDSAVWDEQQEQLHMGSLSQKGL